MNFKNIAKISLAISAVATAVSADNTFYINQAGYDWDKPITIVVKSDQDLEGAEWTLWYAPREDMTAASVATGKVSKGENPDNWTSNGKFYVIDISGKIPATPSGENGENRPMSGNYHVEIATGSPSASDIFYVGQNTLAEKTLGLVMDYFYNDRADKDPVIGWDKKVSVYGSTDVTRDVHGGWYDASGDVSKYLSHLSYANYLNPQQIPLTVWSLAFAAERIPTLLASTSTKATAAAEAAYGADFLVRMLDEQGFFYMTVFDNWGMGSRYLCAFSGEDGKKSANYQTAFREGGGMAIAGLARVAKLGVKGDYTSEQYLEAAQKAYAHLSEKQGIGKSCAYCDDGKENIIDDYTALLAATELFLATGKGVYMNDMEERAGHLADRISEDGYFWSDDAKTRPFWHASDAGLPLIALVRFLEAEMQIEREPCPATADCSLELYNIAINAAHKAISKHIGWLISVTNKVDNPFGYARQTYKTGGNIKDGFFIPHDNESKYWWQGEDARIASLSAATALA
ncbi:MAG: glycoside hydrolase family 9 protein, partial [Fibrobacter sp.]|nr:glycoside hydrolase family 9 protein [Fibrobacter sp.]